MWSIVSSVSMVGRRARAERHVVVAPEVSRRVGRSALPGRGRLGEDGVGIMVKDAMQLTVIGAGAWGTTLAALACERVPTTIWAREQDVADAICVRHENQAFLPGFSLPGQLSATVDLATSVAGADVVVVAVPSPFVRSVLGEVYRSLDPRALVVSVTKGLEAGTGQRMTEVIGETLVGHDPATIGLLAGPNLAREVMAGHPSATCVAFAHLRYATDVQHLLTSERLRIYTSCDVVGCEISGAVKNVIAVAAGMADGLGYGMNTKAALTTRGSPSSPGSARRWVGTRSRSSGWPAPATSWPRVRARSAGTVASASRSHAARCWSSSCRGR